MNGRLSKGSDQTIVELMDQTTGNKALMEGRKIKCRLEKGSNKSEKPNNHQAQVRKGAYQWKQKHTPLERSEKGINNQFEVLEDMEIEPKEQAGEGTCPNTEPHFPATAKRQNRLHGMVMYTWQEEDKSTATRSEDIHHRASPCTQEFNSRQNIVSENGEIENSSKRSAALHKKKNQAETFQILEDNFIGSGEATVKPYNAEEPYGPIINKPSPIHQPQKARRTPEKDNNGESAEPSPDQRKPNPSDEQPTPVTK